MGRLGLVGLSLLVTCVALEVGARIWLSSQDRTYVRADATRDVRLLADQMTMREARIGPDLAGEGADAQAARRRQVLHPFLGWEVGYSFERIRQDQDHFRGPGGAASFDVLVLGGSVAANFGNEMESELAQLLRPLPIVAGRPVRALAYGRGSYKQPQQVIMLAWLLTLGFEPDLVINIDGFNEVAVSNHNLSQAAHPLYPAVAQWAPLARGGLTDRETLDMAIPIRRLQIQVEALAEKAEGSALMHSAVYGSLRYAQARKAHGAWVIAQRALQRHMIQASDQLVVRGPVYEGNLGQAMQTCVRAWLEASRVLQAICEARGILYVGCLQPTLHDEGSKPLTQAERDKGGASEAWKQGVQVGYPLLRIAGRALEREGICFLDATRVFEDVHETLYYDACHFERRGNRILAKAIVEHLAGFLAAKEGAEQDGSGGPDSPSPR